MEWVIAILALVLFALIWAKGLGLLASAFL